MKSIETIFVQCYFFKKPNNVVFSISNAQSTGCEHDVIAQLYRGFMNHQFLIINHFFINQQKHKKLFNYYENNFLIWHKCDLEGHGHVRCRWNVLLHSHNIFLKIAYSITIVLYQAINIFKKNSQVVHHSSTFVKWPILIIFITIYSPQCSW